jgi:Flavin-binding monooxygenase-like
MTGADDRRSKYCIIGAGPSGLAAAAAFRKHGVAYDHLERHTSVGGLWDLANPGTAMYESAHLISSRTMSGFVGFPMPADYPDYPKREQVLNYLRAFARKNDLEPQVEFGRTVERVDRRDDHAVVVSNGEARTYRGVVCASGLNWEPLLPEYEGHFAGELRHAITYKHPSEFEGKRVVIIGLGNSGADIACDAVHRARSVVVSTRRGYHFIPKFIFGKPADVFAHDGPQLPLWLERPIFAFLQRLLVGDVSRLGMPKPDHAVLQSHPLVNDQLLHHLQHGNVSLKGAVRGFNGSTVQFVDGSEAEADFVLMATGYSRRIAYLPAGTFDDNRAASNFVSCFNPKLPNVFTIGFAELNGALYPHLSRLADLSARVAHAQLNAPDVAARFFKWVESAHFDQSGGRQFIDSYRHAHYHDDHALTRATQKAFKAMAWECPTA